MAMFITGRSELEIGISIAQERSRAEIVPLF
jgi:hypothetical protein